MLKSKLLYAAFIFTLLLSMNADAKLFKWVDDQGITHYGEIIPPEYANKERDSLKKSGVIEKRVEKESQESINAKKEAEEKKKIDDQVILEKTRRESMLLNTYSNEKEIDMARDRSLVLINARIDSNKMLLKSSQVNLDEHKKEFDTRTKQGKKIPQSLADDIAQSEEKISKYNHAISKDEEELAAVKLRFEKEKELYRKLKGINTQGK